MNFVVGAKEASGVDAGMIVIPHSFGIVYHGTRHRKTINLLRNQA